MPYDIGPKIGIDGEAEFRKEIQNISENIKTLGSELKVVASAADAEGESIESLSKKNEILNRTISELEKRLSAQQDMLDKATQKFGEADTRTQKWQRTVNETESQLNKLRGEVRKNEQAMDDLASGADDAGDATEELGAAADKSRGRLDAMAVTVGNLAANAIQAAISAITDFIGALWNLDEATEEYRQSQGRLDTAFENAGFSAETAGEAYSGFYAILGDNDRATEAAQLLAQLAENEEDVANWTDIAAGVAGTFGDALPIESLIEAANETANVGEVTGVLADALNWIGISEEEFNTQLAACSTEAERNRLIMDTLTGAYDGASDAFWRNNEVLVETRRNQVGMNDALATLGGTIATLKNQLTNELSPALQGIVTAFSAILGGQEGAGIDLGVALQNLITSIGELAPDIMAAGGQILSNIGVGISTALPTLLEVGGQILSEITQGILDAIPDMVAQLPQIITEFISFISGKLPDILEQGTVMLNNFTSGLISAIPDFVAQLPELITEFVNFIASNLPQIAESGISILLNLIEGIISAIPELIASLPQIIGAIVTGIGNLLGSIVDVGKSIVEGIWQGIKNAASWLIGKITGWFNNIVGGVKKFLGIASPSKLFADEIGENMGLGIGEGFENSMGTVQREINRAMGGLLPDVSGNVSVTGSTASSGGVGSGAADFAGAISRALSGAAVYMDGRKVGQLITRQQNNTIRANGLVPTI